MRVIGTGHAHVYECDDEHPHRPDSDALWQESFVVLCKSASPSLSSTFQLKFPSYSYRHKPPPALRDECARQLVSASDRASSEQQREISELLRRGAEWER